MIRTLARLFVPIIAALGLAGCVTASGGNVDVAVTAQTICASVPAVHAIAAVLPLPAETKAAEATAYGIASAICASPIADPATLTKLEQAFDQIKSVAASQPKGRKKLARLRLPR